MPYTFFPADSRAVGTGNPALDIDNAEDILAGMGGVYNVLNTAFAGGADPTGVADSTAAINACVAAAITAGMPVLIPSGTYKITSTLNWMIANLVVKGAGPANVVLLQMAANIPIIAVAGQFQDIGGFTLRYNTQQTSGQTGAVAMTLGDNTAGSCFISRFHEISINACNTGIGIVSTTVGGTSNCTYENFDINGYSFSAINCLAASGTGFAGATGNVWSNIYIHNNYTGSDANSTASPVIFQSFTDNVFNELNVEHGQVFNGHVLQFAFCGNQVINSLHLEHLEMSGNPGFACIAQLAGGTTVVNGMALKNMTYGGTSYQPIVRFGTSPGNVIINGFNEPAAGTTVSTPIHPWADFNSITNCTAQITGVSVTQVTANQVNGASGSIVNVGAQAPVSAYAPAGAVAETFPRENATTGVTPASGTLTVRVVPLSKGLIYSAATFMTNAAVKTGGTHGWYVLLDYNRVVLAVTADQTDAATVWGVASTPYPLPFAAAYTGQYDGFGYLGVMVAETAGTMPSFAARATPAGGVNGTLTPVLAGTSSAGQTTPPALGATMAAVGSIGTDNLYGYVS